MNVDDLELELRKLPGVRAAGFTERDDVLLIQLQVSGDNPPANLPLQATRIAYRHSEKPVALEVVRWRVVPGRRATRSRAETPLAGRSALEAWPASSAARRSRPTSRRADPRQRRRRCRRVRVDAQARGRHRAVSADPIRRRRAAADGRRPRPRSGCSRCSRFPTPTSSRCTSRSRAGASSAARWRATGSSAVVEAMVDGLKVFVAAARVHARRGRACSTTSAATTRTWSRAS